MKRRSVAGTALGLVAAIALSGVTLALSGFANGSFEDGNWIAGSASPYQTLYAGTASASDITGWAVTAGNIDWVSTFWTNQDGSRSLDMNGTAAGTISQTFATTANNAYSVSFYLSGNPDGGPAVKTLTASATGAAPQTYTFDTTGHSRSSMGWVSQRYSFVATSASTTLTFAADPTNTSFYGPALDNVVVTETTVATGANCKDGGWAAMHDNLGNMFKNQGDCVSYYATGGKNLGSVTQY